MPSEKDVKDTSDNGNDLDGNSTDDPTILVLGIDSDGDGTPDSTDIDDDGDGILDRDEKCLTFLLDGSSFESYTGTFPPGSPANRNSPYPNTTVAPPFTSVNGDGEVWSNSPGPQGTVFSPQQGFYFIELLTNDASANDGSYWNERTIGTNPNYDRIMVIENVYPNMVEVYGQRIMKLFFTLKKIRLPYDLKQYSGIIFSLLTTKLHLFMRRKMILFRFMLWIQNQKTTFLFHLIVP